MLQLQQEGQKGIINPNKAVTAHPLLVLLLSQLLMTVKFGRFEDLKMWK